MDFKNEGKKEVLGYKGLLETIKFHASDFYTNQISVPPRLFLIDFSRSLFLKFSSSEGKLI